MIPALQSDVDPFLLLVIMQLLTYCSFFVGEVGLISSFSYTKTEQQTSSKSVDLDKNGFSSPSSPENMCDMQETLKQSRRMMKSKLA